VRTKVASQNGGIVDYATRISGVSHYQFFDDPPDTMFDDCLAFIEGPVFLHRYARKDWLLGIATSQIMVRLWNYKSETHKNLFSNQKVGAR
jgi:hypothetical protein